jgi:23S rRNA (guanine745-N1)-methyltransferase
MIHEQQILYTVELDKEYLEQLIKMTPLSWNASKDKIQRAFNIDLENITVDFTIMCGKKD